MSNANSPLDIPKAKLYTIASIFTVLAFIIAILWFCKKEIWILNNDTFEPAVYLLGAISTLLFTIPKFLEWLKAKSKDDKSQAPNQQDRLNMLKLVKNTWVEGFLKNSLHKEVLIRIGLKEQKHMVERPFDVFLKAVDKPNQTLPSSTKIINIFDTVTQSLLILGEPGSGKTILLLELVRDMINRAEKDLERQIPVFFNLSSWTNKKQSITNWIVNELNNKYLIPKRITNHWIENNELLLLLDGLDEVAKKRRKECVEAINLFQKEHTMPLVVCCRTEDYEELGKKLKAENALQLQSLSQKQIDKYLNNIGAEFDGVRTTLKNDVDLQELTKSPLMLNIMILAYQGKSTEDIQNIDVNEPRRNHLFRTYIQKMLTRKNNKKSYAPEKILHWIRCMAQRMKQKAQSVFLLEEMQPDWLPSNKHHWLYKINVIFVIMLIFGLIFGLGIGLSTGLSIGLIGELGGKVKKMLKVGLSIGLIGELGGKVKKMLKVGLRDDLINGLVGGLISGLIYVLIFRLNYRFNIGLIWGLIWGLNYGLSFGVSNKLKSEIDTVELLQWSGKRISKELIFGLSFGLSFGLAIGLISGLIFRLNFGLNFGLSYGLIYGLSFGLIFGLIFGLRNLLKKGKTQIKTIPNQGIRQSMKSFVLTTCIYGLSLWLILGLNIGIISGLRGNLVAIRGDGMVLLTSVDLIHGLINGLMNVGLFLGLSIGLFLGLSEGGGLAVIRHFVLRLILFFNGYIPWRYVSFLNYATEQIFLRKVGGGYIFIHRTILEYFASLTDEDIKKIVSGID